jgi:chromosome segregation ATPase
MKTIEAWDEAITALEEKGAKIEAELDAAVEHLSHARHEVERLTLADRENTKALNDLLRRRRSFQAGWKNA